MRRRSSKARKPLRKNRIKRSMSRKSLRRQIDLQLRRAAETKENKVTGERSMVWSSGTNVFNTRNVFTSADILSAISQGTGQASRIGNRIRMTKLDFSFMVFAKSSAAAGLHLPVDVVMYIFSDKLNPTSQSVQSIVDSFSGSGASPYFFQSGNGTSGQGGTITDQLLRVNEDRFTLHKKKIFKIATSTVTNWHNNDYKCSRKFKVNLAKYMPKNVVWSDANNTVLNSRQVWVVFLPVIANDDTSAVFPNSELVNIGFDYQLRFKDI